MITRAHRIVTKSYNQMVHIPCTARGIPRPTITWKRKDRQNLRGHVISRNIRNNEITSSITISRVQTRDAGIYICTSANTVTARPVEQEVTLIVQGNELCRINS